MSETTAIILMLCVPVGVAVALQLACGVWSRRRRRARAWRKYHELVRLGHVERDRRQRALPRWDRERDVIVDRIRKERP